MISYEPYTRFYITRGNILSRSRRLYKNEGIRSLIRTSLLFLKEICLTIIPNHVWCGYHKLFRSSDTFEFQGKTYNYFFHPYATTWTNERTVAVPIIWSIVKGYEGKSKNILEVGNVLSYYFKVKHDILDKYEIMDGVINEDVVDFKPSKNYDLIVSIVTLEHVGWSESPRDPNKTVQSLENLRNLLSPSGQIIVVMGLGLNTPFDKMLRSKRIEFTKQRYLKHVKGYKWQEANWEDVKDLEYDNSVPTANAVIIGSMG